MRASVGMYVYMCLRTGYTAHGRTVGKVATLQHEAGDDTVEDGILEEQGLAGVADALLARAQGLTHTRTHTHTHTHTH